MITFVYSIGNVLMEDDKADDCEYSCSQEDID